MAERQPKMENPTASKEGNSGAQKAHFADRARSRKTGTWSRQSILWVIAGLTILLLLYATDEATYQWISAHHTPFLDRYVRVVRHAGHASTGLVLSLIFAILGRALHNSRWQRVGRLLFISLLVSGLIVIVAKPIFGRKEWSYFGQSPPPTSTQKNAVMHWIDDRWGRFPSGDSTVAFATATTLAIEFPLTAPLLYFIATSAAYGRVYISVHLASDVFAGSYLGWFVARRLSLRFAAQERAREFSTPEITNQNDD